MAEYGVPQLRIRFFLVAERNGNLFNFSTPTHRATEQLPDFFSRQPQQRYVTAWEAIGGIVTKSSQNLQVGGKWGDLLPSIPEGENYLWHTDRKGGLPLFGWRTHYWSFLLKLAKNQPSWTIQAQPGSAIGPFHWNNRRLSWREMAALQTFPRKFRIASSTVEIQRQIGNAVPSLMAEILARAIATQYFSKRYSKRPRLAIQRKKIIPPPEPLRPVPQKYLHLIGEHAPHPGTRRGALYEREPEAASLFNEHR